MKLEKYYKQDLSPEIKYWISHNLSNYLQKGTVDENETEIEHIIDYLQSEKAPKRLKKMSYKEALKSTKKWNDALIRKAENCVETEMDTKEFMKFNAGYKFVELVGKQAFLREGNLMRHCVGSYYGKDDVVIYSLRDSKNNPHCTIEVQKSGNNINQIKGKGNGSIHPNYIKYVLSFLKEVGMEIRGSEMSNLGYDDINLIDKDLWNFIESNFTGAKFVTFNNTKYFYKYSKLKRINNVTK